MAQKILSQEEKKQKRTERFAKIRRTALTVGMTAAMLTSASMTAFADTGTETPENVDTTTMDSLMVILWWVVRVIILAFAIPLLFKVAQSFSDENPRDRNQGIIGLIAIAVIFGATFAIQALIS